METAAEDAGSPLSHEADWTDERDGHVVQSVLAGDVQAFETLIRRYNQRLYRLARGIVSNDHDAREVVQEAYVRAYTKLHTFKGPLGFSTWLHVIARNEALSMLRQRRREMPTEARTMEHLMDDAAPHHSPEPESALETERLSRTLESAIDKLPENFRVVFVLRVVEGMSVRETAQVLDLNEKTVKTRLFRARRMLQERFKGYMRGAGAHVYEFAGRRCDLLTAAVMARISAL